MAIAHANGAHDDQLDPRSAAFYRHALVILHEAGIPHLVGGAYAFGYYTGIDRHTKDFDLFLRPDDIRAALDAIGRAGYSTELTFPHWLGKARCSEDYVDLIFGAGNAVARVDDLWFERAPEAEVLGMPVMLCPPEEMIWSKAFIMERERYDGADVAHLILALSDSLDWEHLIDRFDGYWRVLFSHLVLFGFIYPSERTRVPSWVLRALSDRLREEVEADVPCDPVCRGTLISRAQYLKDVTDWGFEDVRLRPENPMTHDDVRIWTEAIETGD